MINNETLIVRKDNVLLIEKMACVRLHNNQIHTLDLVTFFRGPAGKAEPLYFSTKSLNDGFVDATIKK